MHKIISGCAVFTSVSFVQAFLEVKGFQHVFRRIAMAVFLLYLSLFGLAAGGNALTQGDYSYSINQDGTSVTITKYTGTASDVNIPDTIDGKGVTQIGDNAFFYCSSILRVVIPNGVTSIGYRSFLGCTSLQSANIPDGVVSIGGSAFGSCENLTEVAIPKATTSIGDRAFTGCIRLLNINVEKSNWHYESVDGVLFEKGLWTLITYPSGKNGRI